MPDERLLIRVGNSEIFFLEKVEDYKELSNLVVWQAKQSWLSLKLATPCKLILDSAKEWSKSSYVLNNLIKADP